MSVSVESIVNQNGHAVITFADHVGGRYTETLFVPSGWSQAQLEAHAAARAAVIAESLAEGEAEQVLG